MSPQQFLQDARTAGKSNDEIKQMLLDKGWREKQIQDLFTEASAIKSQPANKVQNAPWPWLAIFIASVIFGMPGELMIVWQNLRRINKNTLATKFLIISWLIFIVLWVFNVKTGIFQGVSFNILGLLPAIWYYYYYGHIWDRQHPHQAKFSWALILWGTIGLLIYLILFFFAFIFLKSFLNL